MGNPRIELTGERFGLLIVVEHVSGTGFWICRCDCGITKKIAGGSLRNGLSNSCGCVRNLAIAEARTKHGMSRSRTYAIWGGMRKRCENSKCEQYKWYGARGIKVCDRWQKFENFLEDMGEAPDGLTIDRFPDNDGDYESGNCRWATQKQQANNRRPRSSS